MQPTKVHYIDDEKVLRITFDDDEDKTYDFPTVYLRGYCPCALCQGHGGGPPEWVAVTSKAQATVEDVTPVGAYAMCIVWADGHDTGIYTFESLAKMGKTLDDVPEEERIIGAK